MANIVGVSMVAKVLTGMNTSRVSVVTKGDGIGGMESDSIEDLRRDLLLFLVLKNLNVQFGIF